MSLGGWSPTAELRIILDPEDLKALASCRATPPSDTLCYPRRPAVRSSELEKLTRFLRLVFSDMITHQLEHFEVCAALNKVWTFKCLCTEFIVDCPVPGVASSGSIEGGLADLATSGPSTSSIRNAIPGGVSSK